MDTASLRRHLLDRGVTDVSGPPRDIALRVLRLDGIELTSDKSDAYVLAYARAHIDEQERDELGRLGSGGGETHVKASDLKTMATTAGEKRAMGRLNKAAESAEQVHEGVSMGDHEGASEDAMTAGFHANATSKLASSQVGHQIAATAHDIAAGAHRETASSVRQFASPGDYGDADKHEASAREHSAKAKEHDALSNRTTTPHEKALAARAEQLTANAKTEGKAVKAAHADLPSGQTATKYSFGNAKHSFGTKENGEPRSLFDLSKSEQHEVLTKDAAHMGRIAAAHSSAAMAHSVAADAHEEAGNKPQAAYHRREATRNSNLAKEYGATGATVYKALPKA